MLILVYVDIVKERTDMSNYKKINYNPSYKGIIPGLIIIIVGVILFCSNVIGLDQKTTGTLAGYEVSYVYKGSGKTHNRYLIDYMFEASGETYTRTSRVKKADLKDNYTVFYSSKNPERSRESGELLDIGIKSAGIVVLGIVLFYCGIPLSKESYEEYLKERRL